MELYMTVVGVVGGFLLGWGLTRNLPVLGFFGGLGVGHALLLAILQMGGVTG